ncbi:MAG: hypothetical protein FWC34_04055 [Bacteroidetes bacterium]|nr:hypothetical protein [Bacteroidota bacterium]MCL2303067.1 hypothetical protein [Lentimicrobiaceae bacterium]
MFYGIVKDFTDEKSNRIQKQENKENEFLQPNKDIDNRNEEESSKYPVRKDDTSSMIRW